MTQTQQPDAGANNVQYFQPPARSFLESLMNGISTAFTPGRGGIAGAIAGNFAQKHADALAQQEYHRQMIANQNNADIFGYETGRKLNPNAPIDLSHADIGAIQQANQNPNIDALLQGKPLRQDRYGAYDPNLVGQTLTAQGKDADYQAALGQQAAITGNGQFAGGPQPSPVPNPGNFQPPSGMPPQQGQPIPPSVAPISTSLPNIGQPQPTSGGQPLPAMGYMLPTPIRNAILSQGGQPQPVPQQLTGGANFQAPQVQPPPMVPTPPTVSPFAQGSLTPDELSTMRKNYNENTNTQSQQAETKRNDTLTNAQKVLETNMMRTHYGQADRAENTAAGAKVTEAGAAVTAAGGKVDEGKAALIKAENPTSTRAPSAGDFMTPDEKRIWASRTANGLAKVSSKPPNVIAPNPNTQKYLDNLKKKATPVDGWGGPNTFGAHPGDINAAKTYNKLIGKYGGQPIPLPGQPDLSNGVLGTIPTMAQAKANNFK